MSSESINAFIKLVRLSARAFYDDPPPQQQKVKPGQSDNKGLGVLIIDSLTKYSSYDAMYLINYEDSNFHCSNCDAVLDCENEVIDPKDESNRQLLERVEGQLRPITEQLGVLAALTAPEFISLEAWEAEKVASVINESADVGIPDAKEEHVKGETKVMPPWMKRQSTSFFDEQLVEAQENNGISSSAVPSDDSKSADMDTAKKVHDEYAISFYKSFYKKQQAEDSNIFAVDHVESHGGKKRKREELDSGESDDDNIISEGLNYEESGSTVNNKVNIKNNGNQVDNLNNKEEKAVDMNEEDSNDDDIEWEC